MTQSLVTIGMQMNPPKQPDDDDPFDDDPLIAGLRRRGVDLSDDEIARLRALGSNKLSPELEADLQSWLEQHPAPEYPDPMLPPWEQLPDIPPRSIGWRMGPGQDYAVAFCSWLTSMSAADREGYVSAHPEPAGWNGYYALITSG